MNAQIAIVFGMFLLMIVGSLIAFICTALIGMKWAIVIITTYTAIVGYFWIKIDAHYRNKDRTLI